MLVVYRGSASASPTLTSSEGRRKLQVQHESRETCGTPEVGNRGKIAMRLAAYQGPNAAIRLLETFVFEFIGCSA